MNNRFEAIHPARGISPATRAEESESRRFDSETSKEKTDFSGKKATLSPFSSL
jgi:hypothetical protein